MIEVRFTQGSQWRNVISGGPRFKIFGGPASISAKGMSRPPYMHKFFRGSGTCSLGKFLNLEFLKFPGLWGEILPNSGGQKTTL